MNLLVFSVQGRGTRGTPPSEHVSTNIKHYSYKTLPYVTVSSKGWSPHPSETPLSPPPRATMTPNRGTTSTSSTTSTTDSQLYSVSGEGENGLVSSGFSDHHHHHHHPPVHDYTPTPPPPTVICSCVIYSLKVSYHLCYTLPSAFLSRRNLSPQVLPSRVLPGNPTLDVALFHIRPTWE